jgi:hypothetical protein
MTSVSVSIIIIIDIQVLVSESLDFDLEMFRIKSAIMFLEYKTTLISYLYLLQTGAQPSYNEDTDSCYS